jgi:PKD repeat protein
MSARLFLLFICPAILPLLTSCGGGGGSTAPPVASLGIPTGVQNFLLLPGGADANNPSYALAYYDAVDPRAERTTLDDFKAVNGVGSTAGAAQERTVVYRNVRELGLGRRVTARYVPAANGIPERVVFIAENYRVDVQGNGSTRANVDAAVARDAQWHAGTTAIEWSCHPDGAGDPACRRYVKFFAFSPDGQRQLTVDLDGRGGKAMPGVCVACHGGRVNPLQPDGSFPKIANTLSDRAGDVQGQLQPFQVDAFEWSMTPGFARSDQEAAFKDLNGWMLCTYPLPVGSADAIGPNGCTRRAAGVNEWEGGAAWLIQTAYGGPGLPDAAYDGSRLPDGWPGQGVLYQQVVAPYCRTCHMVRGTHAQADVDFATLERFGRYAPAIKAHVFDRGDMPFALIPYNGFWNSGAANALASWVDGVLGSRSGTDATGMPLRPGRPVAEAGPAVRMAKLGADAPLSAAGSLFAGAYRWEVISTPPGGSASIANAAASNATFRANAAGNYLVRLTVSNGGQSSTDTTTIVVSPGFSDPSIVRFAHVLDVLRNNPHGGAQSCDSAGCHAAGAPPGSTAGAPSVYAAVDRNGSGGSEDATDLAWLLQQMRGQVDTLAPVLSALLAKPTAAPHAGGPLINLSTTAGIGSYSKLYYWILNGMPGGGVAANPGSDASLALRFTGTPAGANIPLDGSRSVGATTWLWTVLSQPDPSGAPALISNASGASPTLTIRVPGTYVVQLSVTDGGGYSDSATRTLTVSEAAISDAFTSSPGTVDLTGSVNEIYDAPRTAWVPNRITSTSVTDEQFDSMGVWISNGNGTSSTSIVADPDPDVNIGRVLRLTTGAAAGSVAGRQKALPGVPASFGVMVIIKLNAVGSDVADSLLIQQQTGAPQNANLQMRFGDQRMELFYDGAWHPIIAHGGAYYTEWWVQCNWHGAGTLYDLEVYAGTEFVGAVSNVALPAGPPANAGLMVIQQFSGATAYRESRVAVAQVGADVRPSNLILVSRTFAVPSTPTRGKLVILDEDVSNALVPNTDLVASISRDNGATWTALTLANTGIYGPGEIDPSKNINILAGEAAFAGPPGTALRYRVQSSGGKYHALQGVRLEWE